MKSTTSHFAFEGQVVIAKSDSSGAAYIDSFRDFVRHHTYCRL